MAVNVNLLNETVTLQRSTYEEMKDTIAALQEEVKQKEIIVIRKPEWFEWMQMCLAIGLFISFLYLLAILMP